VAATKGATDLPIEFKEAARKSGSQITITIEAGELTLKAFSSIPLLG
jgi:hypothetical protein